MNRILLRMISNGQYHRLMEKWKVSEQDCEPLFRRGTPLSFEKLVSLFFIIGIGGISALIVLLYEKFSYSDTEKQKLIAHREKNIVTFRMTLREVHNCLVNKEWPDPKLLQALYRSSEKVKVE